MSTHNTTVATTPLSAHHSNSATLTQASPHGAPATLSSSSHHSTSHPQQPQQQQQQHHHQHQHHHSSYHHLSYEERLPKLWRPLLSSVANCLTKAEKAAAEPTQIHCKELNDGVVTFLRTRVEWHRLLGNVQAKLQGQAQEREALEGYVRTQPRLGKRKRTTGSSISFPTTSISVVDEVVAAAGLGDELVVLQTAMQQEVAATTTSTSGGIGNDGGPASAAGIGVGGPGGDDFSTDFDGVMVDPMG